MLGEDVEMTLMEYGDLKCDDCLFRHKNVGMCEIYDDRPKPGSVLDGGDCEFYEREE